MGHVFLVGGRDGFRVGGGRGGGGGWSQNIQISVSRKYTHSCLLD